MTNLVIGNGQIGSAIASILNCEAIDKGQVAKDVSYDIIHVAIPYSDTFVETVTEYQKLYSPSITVIHSTVDIGTSDKLGAVYSPCKGIHPNLKDGILTFTKFFAGKDSEKVSKIFYDAGCSIAWEDEENSRRSLEAAKLWDTTQYGLNIIMEKEIHNFCERNNLDFNLVYTMFNEDYNLGYEKLGHPEYKKYVLKHTTGKLGGHCVVPNCNLLNSWVAKLILEKNGEL